jgi:hypothetical protein
MTTKPDVPDELLESVSATTAMLARLVCESETPEAMRAALSNLTNYTVRVGFALELLKAGHVNSAAQFIESVHHDLEAGEWKNGIWKNGIVNGRDFVMNSNAPVATGG